MLYLELKNRIKEAIPKNNNIVDFRKNLGVRFQCLGSGREREVYAYRHPDKNDDVIFKVQMHQHCGSNKKEIDMYETFKKENSPLLNFMLAPIDCFNFDQIGYITVYPRVNLFSTTKLKSKGEYYEYNGFVPKKFNFHYTFIRKAFRDMCASNVGIYEDLPVATDYAEDLIMNKREAETEALNVMKILPTEEI